MNFEVKLPLFKGPFDLLLFFIERDELDIYDIPISNITNDFFEYIEQMEHLNIEVASEFIFVAATLMKIKSKMLLPRPEIDEEGNEVDPRQELVQKLLEYKKYKSILSELGELEDNRLSMEKRGNVVKELKKLSEVNNVEAELQDIDLYKLLKVFQKVMDRFEIEKNRPIHQVVQYPYTMEQQREYIITKVANGEKVSFINIISDFPDKIAVIFNFLSVLELLQMKKISILIGEGYNNFYITSYIETEIQEEPNE